MKKYIKLGYESIITEDKNRLAIHDLINNKTYIINEIYKIKMLKDAFNKFDLEEMECIYGDKWSKFRKELEEKLLVRYSDNNSKFCDKWEISNKIVRNQKFSKATPNISKIYLQINNDCMLNCTTCQNIKHQQFPCNSCRKELICNKDELNIDDYEYILKNIKFYNTKEIVFLGGDPLQDLEKVEGIINLANKYNKNLGYTIITNGVLLLKKNIIEFIKAFKIQLYIQIVEENKVYIKEIVNLIKANNIKSIFIIRENIDNDLVDILKNNNIIFEYYVNIKDSLLANNYLISNKNLSNQVNIISNTIEEDYNLCLYSKAFIKLDGSVYPCNALKYDHIGNIKERNLGKIAVNLEEVWKDKSINLESCSKCSLIKNCTSCISMKNEYKNINLLCEFL